MHDRNMARTNLVPQTRARLTACSLIVDSQPRAHVYVRYRSSTRIVRARAHETATPINFAGSRGDRREALPVACRDELTSVPRRELTKRRRIAKRGIL